jgi:hypothetical protein
MLLALSSLYDPEHAKSRRSHSRHDNAWAIRAMRDFLPQDHFTKASREFAVSAYNSSLSSAGKVLFVDKTPRYFHVLPWLDELFPKAKQIWLKRNPLDVAASYLTTWGIDPGKLTGEPMIPASFDLTIGLQRLADHADASPGVFEVQYEKIATDSTRTMEELCAFLGVAYDPGMLRYSAAGKMPRLQQDGLGDKELYKHVAPHANSLGKWSSVLKPAEIQRLIDFLGHGIFERMGYTGTIQQLQAMGIRFPSANELMDRRHEIMQKDLASPIEALDDSISLARMYYREVREKKFPPWFFTRDGWLTRRIKNQLISSKQGLAHLREHHGKR